MSKTSIGWHATEGKFDAANYFIIDNARPVMILAALDKLGVNWYYVLTSGRTCWIFEKWLEHV